MALYGYNLELRFGIEDVAIKGGYHPPTTKPPTTKPPTTKPPATKLPTTEPAAPDRISCP
jgi:hypothetical protein